MNIDINTIKQEVKDKVSRIADGRDTVDITEHSLVYILKVLEALDARITALENDKP